MTINTTFETGTGLLWFGNTLVSIPVSCADGADEMSVIESWAPFADSPPLHIHHTQDETFVVLKGRLKIALGGKEIILDAGERALAPKGMPHTYRVESPEGAQFLCITKGTDFEKMVRKASRPAVAATLPPPAAPTPEVIAMLTALCAESRIDFVGPPLM